MTMDRESTRSLPPGPKGKPFVGSLFDFQRDPLHFLTALNRDYGDIAGFRIGRRLIVQVSDPELIREILVVRNRSVGKTGYLKRATPILGNGLVTSDGDFHHRQRKLIQPSLDRQRVKTYDRTIVDSALAFGQRWSDGVEVDMFSEMLDLALRIIMRALFSVEVDSHGQRIESALTVVLEHFSRMLSPFGAALSRLPSPRRRRFREAKAYLTRFVQDLIAERRRSQSDKGDVLSMLLLAQDESDQTGMTDQQVCDEVMTLFTAGHETIATALTWTWYALAQNPDVYARMAKEIDEVVGERSPTAADVPQLKYTEMVFAESMRLYPPIWGFTRLANEDQELRAYSIPAGTVIGLSQFVVHRDPRHFESPEAFNPLRWTEEGKSSRPRYSYFPFGGGPRLCVGEPLAWLEGILVLATLCRNWQPNYIGPAAPGFQPLITLRPRNGMPLMLRQRHTLNSQQRTTPGSHRVADSTLVPL